MILENIYLTLFSLSESVLLFYSGSSNFKSIFISKEYAQNILLSENSRSKTTSLIHEREKLMLDCIKIKNSALWNTQEKEWKDKPYTGTKHLSNAYLIKTFVCKIYKELLNLRNKLIPQFLNGQKFWTDTSKKTYK